jgi:uncharacterized membrane protein
MKGQAPGDQPQSNESQPEEVKSNPHEVARAIQGLESDKKLTPQQHEVLEGVLQSLIRKEPEMVAQIAFETREFFSGPLPQAKDLNAYDDETRRLIVNMAVQDQAHTHQMQMTGLTGHINKDKRGQLYGLIVAVVGLGTAAYAVQYSAVAASIIAALDLGTLVYAFIAPRAAQKPKEPEKLKPSTPQKKPRKR